MPIPREQLRLNDAELDELCTGARELHASTVSPDGWPHVVPLWFVWHDGLLWVNSLKRSRRGRDVAAGSKAAVCIDTGHDYIELRGAVFYGRFEDATGDERLVTVRRAYADKYWGGTDMPAVKSHVWLKLASEKLVTWDFRKIPTGADKRIETLRDRKD